MLKGDDVLSTNEITTILLSERLALTAFFVTITRNYHLAEDVYQDVCVKAIGHREPFDSKLHLLNWSRLSGRNRAIDLLRTRDGRYEGLSEKILENLSSAWPETTSDRMKQRQTALEVCLDRLTDNNRQILRLRYFEGRSGHDVAKLLQRRLETIYQALTRIHKSLADCVRMQMISLEDRS
jgi:RNA polymerase sigma-70 factor, ECF subfamily